MIDIEEYTEEQISRALAIAKVGNPLRRVKHGTLGNSAKIFLSSDESVITYQSQHWSPTMVADHPKDVPIAEILEVRSGWRTDNFLKISSNREFTDKILESQCFSLVFRHPFFLIKTLDLVADNQDIQETWVLAVRYLINEIKKETHYFNEEKWLRENFAKGDLNNNGNLSFKELWKLLSELNLELSEKYAKKLFSNADFRKTTDFFGEDALDFDEFLVFFRSLTQRTELKSLMAQYSANKRDYFTPLDLKKFIENVQKLPSITEKECQALIQKFEPELPNREALVLSANGFLKFLLSEYGAIFNQDHTKVFQDMNQPLTNYFIMSSHNTYLIGHQLKGDASIEAYIAALKRGVRVLELDIWDSSPEPIVTHGHTLINPIRLRDATNAINAYAFHSSPYPVILSLEVHCTLRNQKIIADMFNQIFDKKLYIPPQSQKILPSPEELKHKIILKGWRIPRSVKGDHWNHGDCNPDDPDHEEHKIVNDPQANVSEHQTAVDRELSDITCLALQVLTRVETDVDIHPYNGIANFSEKKLPLWTAPNYDSFVRYANKRMVRVYPYGLRTDSSNLVPTRFWNAGIQIVTLNVQHADLSNDLNDGLFLLNGGAGYVLKPELLRKGKLIMSSIGDRQPRMSCRIKIISAQYLPKPSTDNDIIDPYVVVEIHGLPCDTKTFRTKVVKNNGFNPVWNEEIKFDLKAPEFAIIRFVVIDYDKFTKDDFVGEYSLPAISLSPGYRYAHLRTGYMHQDDPSAALFVHNEIERFDEEFLSSRILVQSLSSEDHSLKDFHDGHSQSRENPASSLVQVQSLRSNDNPPAFGVQVQSLQRLD